MPPYIVDKYRKRIKDCLQVEDLEMKETPFGYLGIIGNREITAVGSVPSDSPLFTTGRQAPLSLQLGNDEVLHERVWILTCAADVPIRSHEETRHEIVRNFGYFDIEYLYAEGPGQKEEMKPILMGDVIYSVRGREGFYHGFRVAKEGLLYVAKALKKEWIDPENPNSFKAPPNTY